MRTDRHAPGGPAPDMSGGGRDAERRGFLRLTVGAAGGFFFAGALVRDEPAAGAEPERSGSEGAAEPYDWDRYRWAYAVDTTRCIGCGSCMRACRAENRVPEGFYGTWVERYEIDDAEQARRSIRAALIGFYRRSYPEIARNREAAVIAAADAAVRIWERNVFPEMEITWGTYPNNAGHPRADRVPADHAGRPSDTCTMCHPAAAGAVESGVGGPPAVPHTVGEGVECLACHDLRRSKWDAGAPGCFRCHNDRMRMTAGPRPLEIATDCDTCHYMSFAATGDLVVPRPFLDLR